MEEGRLEIHTYPVGMVWTNCYIAANKKSGECFVVDPGAAAERIAEKIRSLGYKPCAILLTHGHFDHAGGARALADLFGISIYALDLEEDTLRDPDKNVGYLIDVQESYNADVFLTDGQELILAGVRVRVLHTPGHTVGGTSYYLSEEGILFSGDTLFAGSVGRTDFPGGDEATIVRSIREKLFPLTEEAGADIVVYPGHNQKTTIEKERKTNPYL